MNHFPNYLLTEWLFFLRATHFTEEYRILWNTVWEIIEYFEVLVNYRKYIIPNEKFKMQ